MSPLLRVAPLVAAVAAGACQVVPTASVTPRYGPVEVDGRIGVSALGTSVSSSAEGLGIEEDDGVPSPRVDLSWLGFDVWVIGSEGRYEGEGAAEAQLDLGTVVISQGDPVASELDVTLLTGGVTWDLVPGDTVDLGLGLGYGFVDYTADFASLTTGEAIHSEETFGLPLLAARAAVRFWELELSAVAAGLAAEASGDEVAVLDLDVMLRWLFAGVGPVRGGLELGWRWTRVDAEYDHMGSDVEVDDLTFSGPHFGLSLEL